MNPTVTAVIPAYNAALYIGETLRSIIAQSQPVNEIIVIDDFSTDDTADTIESFIHHNRSSRIRLLRNQTNRGASGSRNRGIEAAETEWILFMDADDIAEPELVRKSFEQFEVITKGKKEPYVLIHSAYRQMDAFGAKSELVTRFKQVNADEILGYEFVRNHVYLSGTMVNKHVVIQCGGFDLDLTYCEDWDLWLRLAAIGGFVYVDEPLFNVRRHGTNVSKSIQDVLTGERTVISKYKIDDIEAAVVRRKLTAERNVLDVVGLLYRFDQWEDGFQRLNQYINKHQVSALCCFYKGLFYIHKQQYEQGKRSFIQAVELQNTNAASWNNLGVCHALLGDSDQASHCFLIASKLVPNYLDASLNQRILEDHKKPKIEQLRVTWRELRPVLLKYEN